MTLQDVQDAALVEGANVPCDRCGTGLLTEASIRSAFWRGEELVVIRAIPALVCPVCGEEYVADRTALGLDRIRAAGFTGARVADRMIVPVLDYTEPGGAE